MRQQLIHASKQHFMAEIEKHRMNVEVILRNPTALPDHTDIMDAIEKEVTIMADYKDKLEVLEKYFND